MIVNFSFLFLGGLAQRVVHMCSSWTFTNV